MAAELNKKKIANFQSVLYFKKVGKGTGLGLSVSLGTANPMEDLLMWKLGKGSVFSLILPIRKYAPAEEETKAAEETEKILQEAPKPLTILG